MPDNVVSIAGYHGKWAGDRLSLTSHSHAATGTVWPPLSTKEEEDEGKVTL
jgi:hypothetical protein